MDRETVRRIARLARFSPGEEEVDLLAADLSRILEMFGAIAEVDVEGVLPLVHPGLAAEPPRKDRPRDGLRPDQALEAAPDRDGDRFRVPRVLEHGR